MLTLSRKPGERIVIASNIVVEVLEIQGGRVRLGITAPQQVEIYREEIWVEILKRQGLSPDDRSALEQGG